MLMEDGHVGKPVGFRGNFLKITFRCDSSVNIGTGHVMRCLTLANALSEQGVRCDFVCREHEGNMIEYIETQGFQVYRLPLVNNLKCRTQNQKLTYINWLGTSQEQDAIETINLIKEQQIDWLIIDHYALDATWESALRPYCKKIMVLDDLADRRHDCDLLLDQSLGRHQDDYQPYLSLKTKLLLGPMYLLLRMPFVDAASTSRQSRPREIIKNIFISMGGMDNHNYIGQILPMLIDLHQKLPINVNIIISSHAPHINEIYSNQARLPFCINIYSGCSAEKMVDLIMEADIAISASGFTSYELACMHVPTLLIPLSDIQYKVAKELIKLAPVHIFEPKTEKIDWTIKESIYQLIALAEESGTYLRKDIEKNELDGKGTQRVIKYLME